MDLFDVAIRLALATLAGGALGLNRDLRGKPTGVRTLGLVGLASAMVVMAVAPTDSAAASRVIQGIVTGIGFLGAGVILRNEVGKRVHGLTTAACVWLTACIGSACAVAEWQLVVVTLPFVFAILILGGPFEKLVRGYLPSKNDDEGD
jgi:putative Mg2+ transporter-C (MgtC) family protein